MQFDRLCNKHSCQTYNHTLEDYFWSSYDQEYCLSFTFLVRCLYSFVLPDYCLPSRVVILNGPTLTIVLLYSSLIKYSYSQDTRLSALRFILSFLSVICSLPAIEHISQIPIKHNFSWNLKIHFYCVLIFFYSLHLWKWKHSDIFYFCLLCNEKYSQK